MIGISGKRKLVYGSLLVALVAANALRWSGQEATNARVSEGAFVTEIAPLPDLALHRVLQLDTVIGTRDIFARADPPPVVSMPAAPVQVAAPRPAVDPLQIAKDAAIRQFQMFELVGILRSGDTTQVVLRLDGQNRLLTVGEDAMPGYVVESATNDAVRIAHAQLDMAGIVTMNGIQETIILDQVNE